MVPLFMLTKRISDYEIEDLLKEVDHIQLIPMRKKNSKDLCHLLSLLSRATIVKELKQLGA